MRYGEKDSESLRSVSDPPPHIIIDAGRGCLILMRGRVLKGVP